MLTGFADGWFDGPEARIGYSIAGDGPPLLLLHGFPQTRAMWHHVAPALVERFTVICPDLRGYGASAKLTPDADHLRQSKRAMAGDMAALMTALGHDRFQLAGHDRGARVAHRLAMDHGERVDRLCLMDIVPGSVFYDTVTKATASAYWHWFFLIQPAPMPETMLAHDPGGLAERFIRSAWRGPEPLDPRALAAYRAAAALPDAVRSWCEDYRAGATADIADERADQTAGRKLACPTLLLWAAQGLVGRAFDPLAVWRDWCADVTGAALDCGHFLPEERPEEVLDHLLDFFG